MDDAQITAIGSSLVAVATCIASVIIMLRKQRVVDDGTTIGQWRAIVKAKDAEIAEVRKELAAERATNSSCQIEKATLREENRHLKEQLVGLGAVPRAGRRQNQPNPDPTE